MYKSYIEAFRAAKYKLPGHGTRSIEDLLKAFEDIDPSTVIPDTYGSGKVINDFEEEVAELLGKEKGVFFPSGTMAQQIALRIWADKAEVKRVAYHPLCHLEIHEKDGLKVLHNLEPILLGDKDRIFNIEDLKSIDQPISSVLIELPQREIGGQLPSYDSLVEISEYCKAKGIKLHLDGARLFEALPYYNKTAEEICRLFDSVYVSFYKGLGGIAGAMLAGEADFMEEAKTWKRRHGGDLISLYPYIINAKFSLKKRCGKMKEYWQHALTAAEHFNSIEGVRTVPEVPVCNMFHLYFKGTREHLEETFIEIVEKYDIALVSNLREVDSHGFMCELSFGDSFSNIPKEVMSEAFNHLKSKLNKIHAS